MLCVGSNRTLIVRNGHLQVSEIASSRVIGLLSSRVVVAFLMVMIVAVAVAVAM